MARLKVDVTKLHKLFSELRPGTYQAINDISIANELSVRPYGSAVNETGKRFRLSDILMAMFDSFEEHE